MEENKATAPEEEVEITDTAEETLEVEETAEVEVEEKTCRGDKKKLRNISVRGCISVWCNINN